MSGGRTDEPGDAGLVVVPAIPGPLLRPTPVEGATRNRDDLDDLIDELLPDSSEGPGVTDVVLVGGGTAMLGWAALGSPPVAAAVAGAVALGLGCILPFRAGWRRLTERRRARRRAAVLARGVPLRTADHGLARLVAAYEELDAGGATPAGARAAAHGAVLEVASLLGGRMPVSDRERAYVEARTASVEELLDALRELDEPDAPAGEDAALIAPDLVVEAREELDALGAGSSLSRLDEAIEEVRARGRRR